MVSPFARHNTSILLKEKLCTKIWKKEPLASLSSRHVALLHPSRRVAKFTNSLQAPVALRLASSSSRRVALLHANHRCAADPLGHHTHNHHTSRDSHTIHMYVCVYIYIYIYIYACMYVHVYHLAVLSLFFLQAVAVVLTLGRSCCVALCVL